MEGRTFPRRFTEAELGARIANTLANGTEDRLRTMMAEIVKGEGCGFPIHNEKNDAVFLVNIDPSKLSRNNLRKMITAYTIMDVEDIREFLQDLCYKSCVDKNTRGAKIRCDLRLEGRRVFWQVKVWEQGDSDDDDLGDEDEDESLFEETLNCKTWGDTIWTRRIWFEFEQMKAPQLRRVMHMICGGLYILELPAEENYFNDKDDLASQRTLGTIIINGIRVVLTHEAETCEILEALAAHQLGKVLRHLCNARVVFISVNGKRAIIDGRKIITDLYRIPQPQVEILNESEEQDPVDQNPENEETSDDARETEVSDEGLSEPEPPIPRKRPRLWVDMNPLLR